MAAAPEPILVSVEDGANMLGLCRATFYKLLNTGKVRAVKHARRTLVPVEALKSYAASLPAMAVSAGTDAGSTQFDERPRKLVKHKPVEKSDEK